MTIPQIKLNAEKSILECMRLKVRELQSAKKNRPREDEFLKFQPSGVTTNIIKQGRTADGKHLVTLIPVTEGDRHETLRRRST